MKTENEYIALLTHDKINIKNPITNKPVTLYRIIAKKSFYVENKYNRRTIDAYQIGGYIESIDNLDDNQPIWIGNRSRIFGEIKILDNSIIIDNAIIYGKGTIKQSFIKNNVRISTTNSDINDLLADGLVEIKGNVKINDCEMHNSSMIFENPIIEKTQLYDGSVIRGNATVSNSVLKDVSEIRGNANVINCQLQNRGIISEGIHENETISRDLELNTHYGEGDYIP